MTESLILDHNSEDKRGRSGYRKFHHVPPSLETSPYLSSPIRPIPSLRSRSRGSLSVTTRATLRSRSDSRFRRSRANSPSHSTVVTFNDQSPYENPPFSRQSSFESMRTTVTRSDARSVLLPSEIDDLAKIWPYNNVEITIPFKDSTKSVIKSVVCGMKETEIDLKDVELDRFQDFGTDDEWTVTSDCAMSLSDSTVFEKINDCSLENDNVLFRYIDPNLNENDFFHRQKIESSESQQTVIEPQIKLPPVISKEKNVCSSSMSKNDVHGILLNETKEKNKSLKSSTMSILKSSAEPHTVQTIIGKKKKSSQRRKKKKRSSKVLTKSRREM